MKTSIYKYLLLEIKGKIALEEDIKQYGICLGCNNFEDGGYCNVEELQSFPYKARKKKCKYFEKLEPDYDYYDAEDYLEDLDSRVI